MLEKNPKIYIYISTFGQPVLNIKHGIPIEVGADNRKKFVYNLKDNTGVNISSENDYFGELTGLYWAWKNTGHKKNDIIGFAHYNKGLFVSDRRIRRDLLQNGWLVYQHKRIPSHPKKNELNALVSILKNDYPLYYQTWSRIYDQNGASRNCNGAQLFITTYSEFNRYCDFLFGVLFKLRKKVGDSSADRYYRRYCAFMGERLLSVYINTVEAKVKEYPLKYPNLLLTIGHIFFNNNSMLKKILKDKLKLKSSYKN